MNGKKIEQKIINERKRSEKCPLREMPAHDREVYHNDYDDAHQDGWNDCLDTILERASEQPYTIESEE